MANEQAFIEKAENALHFLQGIEFDQEFDDPNDTRKFWEYYNEAYGVMHELLNRYKTTAGVAVLLETDEKVSIKPQAMSLQQAVHLFESLNPTGRQEFYESLTDDERDALYMQATDNLIARVDLTTKNRTDEQTNKVRQKKRGYVLPDEVHHTENDTLWRSAAWRVLFGQVCESLPTNLSHLQVHFDALKSLGDI